MKTVSKIFLLVALASCVSCVSVSDRAVRLVNDQTGKGIIIQAKAKCTSAFDPDGGSRQYIQSVKIHFFGKGCNMSYRKKPGIIYRFGKDFDVDVDYYSSGYLWISEDQKKLGISLFDVNPPTALSASPFNGVYTLTAAEVSMISWFQGFRGTSF